MKILAIETSCDDTGIAILEYSKTGQPKILANLVSSQIKVHAPWGGVVPSLAKREHQRNLAALLSKALKKITSCSPPHSRHPERSARLASTSECESRREGSKKDFSFRLRSTQNDKMKILKQILEREPELLKELLPFLEKYQRPDIDYIAVTQGPGLEPALWVGVNLARALSYYWDIPIIPINHIEGHLTAALAANKKYNAPLRYAVGSGKASLPPLNNSNLPPLNLRGGEGGVISGGSEGKLFPAIALIASGGHTQLVLVKNIGDYQIVGETRDDAAGEAFDKVAKMLDLGYPGGPAISQIANRQVLIAKRQATGAPRLAPLPRPMLNSGDLDFSFSGLKTATLYTLQKMTPAQIKEQTPAIAAEFQQAVIDVLSAKTLSAVKKYNAQSVILAGGVAANPLLRKNLSLITDNLSLNFLVPPLNLCLDNAAMIALAAHSRLAQKRAPKTNWRALKAEANLRIS